MEKLAKLREANNLCTGRFGTGVFGLGEYPIREEDADEATSRPALVFTSRKAFQAAVTQLNAVDAMLKIIEGQKAALEELGARACLDLEGDLKARGTEKDASEQVKFCAAAIASAEAIAEQIEAP